MSWDEACEATRGLLDYMENEIPSYVEQAFSVHRNKNVIGTGALIRFIPGTSSQLGQASKNATIVAWKPNTDSYGSEIASNGENASGICAPVDEIQSEEVS